MAHEEPLEYAMHTLIEDVYKLACLLERDNGLELGTRQYKWPSPYNNMQTGRKGPMKFQVAWSEIAKHSKTLIESMRGYEISLYLQVALTFSVLVVASEKALAAKVTEQPTNALFARLFDNASFAADVAQSIASQDDVKTICSLISSGFLENRQNIEIAVSATLIDPAIRGMLTAMGTNLRNVFLPAELSKNTWDTFENIINAMDPPKGRFDAALPEPKTLNDNVFGGTVFIESRIHQVKKPRKITSKNVAKEGLTDAGESFKHTIIALKDCMDIQKHSINIEQKPEIWMTYTLWNTTMLTLFDEASAIQLNEVDGWKKYNRLLTKIRFIAQASTLALTGVPGPNISDIFASTDKGLLDHQEALSNANRNTERINAVMKGVLKKLGDCLQKTQHLFNIFGPAYHAKMKEAIGLMQKA